MPVSAKSKAVAESQEVLIERTFDAPRELVFRMWTDPRHLVQWYAPPGCGISFTTLDVRPGGRFQSCITIPVGKQCWCAGEYRELITNERIAFTMSVSNAAGESITAIEAGMDPDWPQETTVTVTFAERGGKTTMTLHQTVDQALAKRTGAYPSWLAMFDKLAELMAANGAQRAP